MGSSFTINQGSGNSGWNSQVRKPYCGDWPQPAYGYPGARSPVVSATRTATVLLSPSPRPDASHRSATPSAKPSGRSSPTPTRTVPSTVNLALHKPISASSYTDVYVVTNADDGNASSYWESTNNVFPQSLTIDLGASTRVGRVVLKLPPLAAWGARTQTLSILGSTNNSNYRTLVGSAGYRFDPATANTVTIRFTASNQRYLRLSFTANNGWPAAQASEVEVYAS